MKRFNCFFLVFALFFFAACSYGVERIVPETEKEGKSDEKNNEDDGNSVIDDDVSDSSVEPSEPDSDSGSDSDTADTSGDGDAADSDDTDSGDDSDSGTPDDGDTTEEKYCSAVFNGESSKIEIPANDALNLAYETWTIEAWIKQAAEDVNENNVPIVRKGAETKSPVYLLTGYKKQQQQQGWETTLTDGLMGYVSYSYTSETGGGYPGGGWNQGSRSATLQSSASNVTYSADWSHIAMVHMQVLETDNSNPWSQQEKTVTKLVLFLNGKQVASENYNDGTITVNTNEDPLVIGANVNSNFFFKGLIDSIKISNTTKYIEDFTPSALSADENTVAFWDFNNDTNDASPNALNGIGTNIIYSTDCME